MRISDWSSDVCSSDLTAAYEMAIRAGYGEFADAFLARYPAKTIEDSMLAATRDAMYGWTAERLVSNQARSEEHTSELQSLMRISYAVFCLKKTKNSHTI